MSDNATAPAAAAGGGRPGAVCHARRLGLEVRQATLLSHRDVAVLTRATVAGVTRPMTVSARGSIKTNFDLMLQQWRRVD